MSIGDAQVAEGDSGTSSLVFQVHLSKASTVPVKVDYATADGTATSGVDYLDLGAGVDIPAGQASGRSPCGPLAMRWWRARRPWWSPW